MAGARVFRGGQTELNIWHVLNDTMEHVLSLASLALKTQNPVLVLHFSPDNIIREYFAFVSERSG